MNAFKYFSFNVIFSTNMTILENTQPKVLFWTICGRLKAAAVPMRKYVQPIIPMFFVCYLVAGYLKQGW